MLVIRRKAIQSTILQQTGNLRPYQHVQEWKTKNLAAEVRQRVKLKILTMSFLYYSYLNFKNFKPSSFCLNFFAFKDSGGSSNNQITIEIKGSTETIGENEVMDTATENSKHGNQEISFLLLETKGNDRI